MKSPGLLLIACIGLHVAVAAEPPARNVILFLGDAGGIATLNAASIHGYGEAQKLYIQSMPHLALSDTSTATEWVSDSAAGMTAIVTGHKTRNGVLSQSSAAIRGKQDGAPLKTILEYAEERGLSTGIVTNRPLFDATPAACYAHVNDRKNTAAILQQFLQPRFGDGVDVLIGAGRKDALAACAAANLDWPAELQNKGYQVLDSIDMLPASPGRTVALLASGKYELQPVLNKVIPSLAKNPKGYFLMVEWDMHTDKVAEGLNNVVEADKAIRHTVEKLSDAATLIVFTADHSFDLRVKNGRKGEALLAVQPEPAASKKPVVRVDGDHTGEEVLVAAQGPGAERVRGFMPNTEVFRIITAAFGWKQEGAVSAGEQ